VKKPNKPLLWSTKDFHKGKKWAMTQPHPNDPKQSLWDYISIYKDSVLIIHEINLRLNEQ
jgi:hypothetical protein